MMNEVIRRKMLFSAKPAFGVVACLFILAAHLVAASDCPQNMIPGTCPEYSNLLFCKCAFASPWCLGGPDSCVGNCPSNPALYFQPQFKGCFFPGGNAFLNDPSETRSACLASTITVTGDFLSTDSHSLVYVQIGSGYYQGAHYDPVNKTISLQLQGLNQALNSSVTVWTDEGVLATAWDILYRFPVTPRNTEAYLSRSHGPLEIGVLTTLHLAPGWVAKVSYAMVICPNDPYFNGYLTATRVDDSNWNLSLYEAPTKPGTCDIVIHFECGPGDQTDYAMTLPSAFTFVAPASSCALLPCIVPIVVSVGVAIFVAVTVFICYVRRRMSRGSELAVDSETTPLRTE